MSEDYSPPKYKDNIKLPGKTGRLAFESTIKGFVKSGKISEHDALIGRKLAFVLTGGDKGGPMSGVDEQYLPKDGYLELRDRPGLGVEVNEDAISDNDYTHWQRTSPIKPDGSTGYI